MRRDSFELLTDPNATPELSSKQVHLWRVALNQFAMVPSVYATLSSDERERAKRFHFDQDRNKFIVARGILRLILGKYLGVDPSQVQFCYGPKGKPTLAPSFDSARLQFSLSHSNNLALFAFALDIHLGIDIEHIHPVPDVNQLVERFFSLREQANFRALPKQQQVEAFFNGWTRKEAFIKALGEGLSYPLDRFDVSLVLGEPAALLNVDGDPMQAKHWTIYDIASEPDYKAALVAEGHDHCLAYRTGSMPITEE